MPVLSPHRSSVTGSYRSSLGSSTLNRYPSTTSYTPNFYYERYSTRSYTDSDGRRVFTRSGSITEDGKTSRYYEESREGSSTRRESISRDSGISSIRENSILDTSPSSKRDRESSLTRGDSSSRYTQLNVVDSLADLRSRYSPAHYVPAVYRNKENLERISRSKSINDIGKPPAADKTEKETAAKIGKQSKVKQNLNNGSVSVVNLSNNININNDNVNISMGANNFENDTNGNDTTEMTQPVSELRKKFENKFNSDKNENRRPFKVSKLEMTGEISAEKVPEKRFDKSLDRNDAIVKVIVNGVPTITNKSTVENGSRDDTDDPDELENSSSTISINEVSSESSTLLNGVRGAAATNRVSNFSSYIPVKTYEKGDLNGGDVIVKNGEIPNGGEKYTSSILNDLTTSQRLNKALTQNAAGTSTANATTNNIGRSSLERDDEKIYDKKLTSPIAHQGLNGLKNIGNTCFMNSVIQCLSNTKPLLEYVRKDQYANEINTTISSMKGALMKAFAQVIKELWSEDSSDRVVNTVALKSQIQRFAPRFMGYAQQDAQEFLRYLLEGLHEDVNRVTTKPTPIHTEIDEKLSDSEKSSESWQRYLRMDNSKIVDIFVGQLKSTLKCMHCGHCSVTFDPFWDLSLPIPQKVGPVRLQQCLESFTREETLDGDEKPTCSKCKERRKCTKSFAIQKFPKILVIHLKRFSPMERFRGKLSVTVDFPLEGLDMSNYSADNHTQCRYNLYAISNHSGTTYSGHYTAYCRHPYSQAWHEYNDSRVSSISSKSIISGEAYVLFYELDGQKSHL